jgi:uncharacterized protein
LRKLAEAFARQLVDDPSAVVVEEHTGPGWVRIELEVAPEDTGRVIGRRGRTVEALRTVLSAVAKRQGRRCDIEIYD